MAISLISIKCPECGAELSIENGRNTCFCSYCGTKVMISNENEHIYRNIDEARIKEAETERILKLRDMELAEKEERRGNYGTLVAYGIALAFVLFGAIICIFNSTAGMFGIMIGAYIALFTFMKGMDKKKRKRKYVGPDEVQISESMSYVHEKNYNSIVLLYKGAGFTNVTAVPLNDLSIFSFGKNGTVESVTINGNGDFEEGDVFPKSANVLITYHSRG